MLTAAAAKPASATSPGASPWVSALSALPLRERLEVQRAVTADVAAQASASPSAPYFSRAYASGSAGALAPRGGGLGVFAGARGPARSGAGGSLEAVTRRFPSTAELLSGMLSDAGVLRGGGGGGGGGGALDPAVDPALAALAADVRARGLDGAYRVVLLRALARRLASDATWREEEGGGGGGGGGGALQPCFPATHALISGALLAAAVPVAAPAAVPPHAPAAATAAAAGGGGGDDDDYLDAILDAAEAAL